MKSLSVLSVVGAILATAAPMLGAEPAPADGRPPFSRGPYLQLATPDSVTVVCRTEGAIRPVVRYGSTLENLDRQVSTSNARASSILNDTEEPGQAASAEAALLPKLHSAPAGVFQYEVLLTGLKPNSRYYYAVYDGDRRLTGPDSSYSFVTYPARGEAKSLRFWVVGDSGTGRETQHSVHAAMLNWIKTDKRPLDLCLHLGGMAFTQGRDVEFQARFFEMYDPTLRQVVCWPTLGDTEGATSSSSTDLGPYFDAFVCPTQAEAGGVPSDTEAFYSFDYGRVHFICLNSHDTDRKPTGPMARWLKMDLEQTRATHTDWVIVYFHHPPYTKGTHDSDRERQLIEMRTHIMPILDSGGVDLVLSAHSHIYERSMLMDGAYATPTLAAGVILNDGEGDPGSGQPYRKSAGIQPNGGTIHVVAGHGGTTVGRKGTMPVMRKTAVEHGSVIVDIDGDVLQGRMLNKFGEVRDVFGLIKRGQVAQERVLRPWQPQPWKAVTPQGGAPVDTPEDFFVVIPKYAEWTYLAGEHPEGTSWTQLDFEGAGWKQGQAPFGFEYKEARTVLDDMKGRSSVCYIRHTFEIKNTDRLAELGLMINYDDGFIAYLNGQEVLRKGVGKGNGQAAREIRSHDATRYLYYPIEDFAQHLRSGMNVLAIEGHNISPDSRDFLLDPYLIIED